ncbi:hypothetical protein L1987_48695 [Smallanthus sonchifolius]|uniref:Uncharacterized protein n=1 Tax=Smallanthus sonchifolius TaxID=185202 RepID=A0ACB9FTK1_9ASTR|nr:hypothetical protein L1987_48695 [Smallanthus sonchifolius]
MYNSHAPPYSKSGRFAGMPAPHVPTPFVCNLSADNYIQTSDSDSFASCAESDCAGSKDDCDESSSKGNVLNELESDECNNMSVSKPDICEHIENLYFGSVPSKHESLRNAISKFKNALPFFPKYVNAMSCIANFKSAGVVVTDIPQETMSNLEFFRLKEDQSLQERNIEERVTSSSDVSTSQSYSSSCDDNYQAKPTFDKGQLRRTGDNIWHVDSGCSRHMTGYFSLLQDYYPMDGDFDAFADNPRGGKIEGQGTVSNGVNSLENVNFFP